MAGSAPIGRRMFLYNTVCEIILWEHRGEASAILDKCEDAARGVQSMLNAYDPRSELGRLNREHQTGKPYMISPELYALLLRMDRFSKVCDGAFDATVRPLVELWNFTASSPAPPTRKAVDAVRERCGYQYIRYNDADCSVIFAVDGMSIDAGGVGKGYAVGRVVNCLREHEVTSASLNFGGELYLLGPCVGKKGPADWRIAVQKPGARRGEALGVLALRDCAVATSGSYDRFFAVNGHIYSHILDPRTGCPAPCGVAGVTVVCDDPVKAELLSTAIFVLGRKDGAELAASQGADYLIADESGIAMSEGLTACFGGTLALS